MKALLNDSVEKTAMPKPTDSFTFTFSHLADAFVQSDVQRTREQLRAGFPPIFIDNILNFSRTINEKSMTRHKYPKLCTLLHRLGLIIECKSNNLLHSFSIGQIK